MKKIFTLLVALVLFIMQSVSYGQTPNLGTAYPFAVFTAAGAVTVDGASTITGDIGTYVGEYSFTSPAVLVGTPHVLDGVAFTAAADVATAYAFLAALTPVDVIGVGLGGQTLLPGVHSTGPGAAATLNGTLVLDGQGNPDAVFVIKIDGPFATAASSVVSMINLANVCNVYWQINGQVDIQTGTVFVGTILAHGAINMFVGSSLLGRVLSTEGAINVHTSVVAVPVCACTVPAPTVGEITQADCFTATGSVVLSGLPAGDWTINPGAIAGNTSTTTVSGLAAGTYNFTVTSGLCTSPPSADVVIYAQPLPVGTPVFTAGIPYVCQDAGNITYTATAENSTSITYSVLPVEVGVINPTSGVMNWDIAYFGPATITATATGLCGTTTKDFVISVIELPPVPTVVVTQPTESVPTGTIQVTAPIGSWMSYSIYGTDYTNSNETGIFSLVAPGTYYVTDRPNNGCISPYTLVTINNVITAIEKIGGDSNFDVYPVPNDGQFTVVINTQTEKNFDILITNAAGSKIYEQNNIRVNGTTEQNINITQAPRGMYYIMLRSGNDKVVRKIMISK